MSEKNMENKFTIKDAKEIVSAWECLSEGMYDADTISDWLENDMAPVINKFRSKIKEYE